MGTIRWPTDFREFLQLLNSGKVEYLVVGGYAVGFHGTPRATGDLDIWIAARADNAGRLVNVLEGFGFAPGSITVEVLLIERRIVRIGMPPLRIEILTGISGVAFDDCYARRQTAVVDGVPVSFIALDDLKLNKRAAGRPRDLGDLDQLP